MRPRRRSCDATATGHSSCRRGGRSTLITLRRPVDTSNHVSQGVVRHQEVLGCAPSAGQHRGAPVRRLRYRWTLGSTSLRALLAAQPSVDRLGGDALPSHLDEATGRFASSSVRVLAAEGPLWPKRGECFRRPAGARTATAPDGGLGGSITGPAHSASGAAISHTAGEDRFPDLAFTRPDLAFTRWEQVAMNRPPLGREGPPHDP